MVPVWTVGFFVSWESQESICKKSEPRRPGMVLTYLRCEA